MAARALGGEVGFIKTYVQGFTFHRLPGRRTVVFASRAALGLADGFAREVQPTDADGNPDSWTARSSSTTCRRASGSSPAATRRFAASPSTASARRTRSARNGFPTGGNAVLLLNGELRFPVWRDVGAVVFVDGGNVFRRVTEFDFGELRGSYGFGLRYQSPVGPIRVDLGFKMDRRVVAASSSRRRPSTSASARRSEPRPRIGRATDDTDATDDMEHGRHDDTPHA